MFASTIRPRGRLRLTVAAGNAG